MTSRTFGALALAAIVAAMALAGRLDADEQQRQHAQYCDNVALWQHEAALGISPYDRAGHPDYDGIAVEHCPGITDTRQLASHATQ